MFSAYDVVRATGYTNLIFFILILFTCRCIVFWKIAKRIVGDRMFSLINRFHCLYWYGFSLSVFMHILTINYPSWVDLLG